VTRRLLPTVTALATAVLGLSTACGGSGSAAPPTASKDALHGAVPDVASPKPTFTLTDTSGASYDFRKRTDGKVTLLYFGYTHCPDECPTSMADVASALRRVPTDVASDVAVVFVTTDPWRDTKPALRTWLDRFSSAFVGLTGKPAQIAGAETQMGMPISRRVPAKKAGAAGRYSVDHFAAVLTYGRDGRLATLYPSGVTPTDIAADLQVLVKG
jgi:protein SCO1/2